MSDNDLIQKIHDLDVVGIRTEDFDSYLNMWVVVVNGRLFARSWSTSLKVGSGHLRRLG